MVNQISFCGFKFKYKKNNNVSGTNYSYKTDIFSRSNDMMSNHKNIKEQEICKSLADLNLKKVLSSLVEKNNWNNGLDDINIQLKNNKPHTVSIDLFDFDSGKHNVSVMNFVKFVNILSDVKDINAQKFPQYKTENAKLFSLLQKKIDD